MNLLGRKKGNPAPEESGSVDDVFYRPRMPYTVGLLNSLPRMDTDERIRLIPIGGTPPSLANMPPGCPFTPRCPLAIDECSNAEPALMETDGSEPHFAACIRSEELRGQDRYQAGEVFGSEPEAIPTELVQSFEAEAIADQASLAEQEREDEGQRSETSS